MFCASSSARAGGGVERHVLAIRFWAAVKRLQPFERLFSGDNWKKANPAGAGAAAIPTALPEAEEAPPLLGAVGVNTCQNIAQRGNELTRAFFFIFFLFCIFRLFVSFVILAPFFALLGAPAELLCRLVRDVFR